MKPRTKQRIKTFAKWVTIIGLFAFMLPSPLGFIEKAIAPYKKCWDNHLSKAQIEKYNAQAELGDGNSLERLADYYLACEADELSKMMYVYKKYQLFSEKTNIITGLFLETSDEFAIKFIVKHHTDAFDFTKYAERKAVNDPHVRVFLPAWLEMMGDDLPNHIPKSLYYSKLDGCDTNKEYSYASYLHTLFHNYPDNKEYVKVAYAMLLFTKFNANQFYNYSKFDALEQNMTSRLDAKGVSYIIHNYQSIIAKECEGILADHSQVPTEAKLMQYAFPLKSDEKQE